MKINSKEFLIIVMSKLGLDVKNYQAEYIHETNELMIISKRKGEKVIVYLTKDELVEYHERILEELKFVKEGLR